MGQHPQNKSRTAQSRNKARRGNRLAAEHLESRLLLAADWQNPSNPFDVEGSDGPDSVSPLDALLVINELHDRGVSSAQTGQLPDLGPDDASPPPFVDVNGDNIVSPLDALLVINELDNPPNANSAASTPRSTSTAFHRM